VTARDRFREAFELLDDDDQASRRPPANLEPAYEAVWALKRRPRRSSIATEEEVRRAITETIEELGWVPVHPWRRRNHVDRFSDRGATFCNATGCRRGTMRAELAQAGDEFTVEVWYDDYRAGERTRSITHGPVAFTSREDLVMLLASSGPRSHLAQDEAA
jgi:hypothetical protein